MQKCNLTVLRTTWQAEQLTEELTEQQTACLLD